MGAKVAATNKLVDVMKLSIDKIFILTYLVDKNYEICENI